MCFSLQKKELINLKNTLNGLENKAENRWILEFSIVKLVSIWEQIIRSFSDKNLSEIKSNDGIEVVFDKKRFYEFVWKSWLEDKQPKLTNEEIKLQIKDVKKYSKIRNKVAHGNALTDDDEEAIANMGNDGYLLNKTLMILEGL